MKRSLKEKGITGIKTNKKDKAMKSNSNIKPKVFENLGSGAWHYNYNIEKVTKENENGTQEESYDYDQVKVWGMPTKGGVTKLVIADKYSIEKEIDLANDYTRHALGISSNVELKNRYIDYLNDVDAIKAMVADSFLNNINELNG